MILQSKDAIGLGIYTPAEAALYARVKTQLINRWLFGNTKGAPVIRPQVGTTDDRVVTFLDLIQALAIRAIRIQYPQISLSRIRKAVANAERMCGNPYPFAMRHATFVFFRGGAEHLTEPPDEDQDDSPICEIVLEKDQRLTQLTGKKAGNQLLREVAELYMENLSFGEDGLASEFIAYKLDDLSVRLNPQRHFGEPLVPSGYTAFALWEAVKAEGSIDAAARAYGVDRREVELACGYFDFLRGPAAGER